MRHDDRLPGREGRDPESNTAKGLAIGDDLSARARDALNPSFAGTPSIGPASISKQTAMLRNKDA
jgi:hypothetical protein